MLRLILPFAVALVAVVAPVVGSAAGVGTASETPLGSLALSVLPDRTVLDSGGNMGVTLTARSTGTQTATSVTACLRPPQQLTVARAPGAVRRARDVCFTLGDMKVGAQKSRRVLLRAAAGQTMNVQIAARATSTCRCSGRPTARSPIIRIVRRGTTPGVTG
jgi:hypothetical protein